MLELLTVATLAAELSLEPTDVRADEGLKSRTEEIYHDPGLDDATKLEAIRLLILRATAPTCPLPPPADVTRRQGGTDYRRGPGE